MPPSIEVQEVPSRPALMVHARFPKAQIGAEVGKLLGDVQRWAGQHAVATSGPAFARYARWANAECELDAGFVVDHAPDSADPPIATGKIGGCLAASVTHLGPYERLSETYAWLQKWIAFNGYLPAGEMWEEYLSPPNTPPELMRTQVFCPVRKAD